MLGFPLEVIEYVAEELDARSLLAFSSVCRSFRTASLKQLYHTISLTFSSPETLSACVDKWRNVLRTTGTTHDVRKMYIHASDHSTSRASRGTQIIRECKANALRSWTYTCPHDYDAVRVTEDDDWRPLVRLIMELPNLRDIDWGYQEQVPPGIVDLLYTTHSDCSLHVRAFLLRSLDQPAQNPIRIGTSEMRLATCPNLHSSGLKHLGPVQGDYANHNESAVLEMAAGAAPRLRQVSIWRYPQSGEIQNCITPGLPRQIWHARQQIWTVAPDAVGSLQHLELRPMYNSMQALQSWKLATDFAKLASLKIHEWVDVEMLDWLAANCSFTSLDTLAMLLTRVESPEDPVSMLDDAFERFLLTLPPLQDLDLPGDHTSHLLQVVAKHSGHSLRHLHLSQSTGNDRFESPSECRDSLTPELLQLLRRDCPQLETLEVTLSRSGGDAREAATYHALGSIRSLRTVVLKVYIPQEFAYESEGVNRADRAMCAPVDDGCSLRKEAMQALRDIAIDKVLATSIFSAISRGKMPYAPRLERVILENATIRDYGDTDLGMVMHYIGRSWTCTGSLRDDEPNQCIAEECDDKEIEERRLDDEEGLLTEATKGLLRPILLEVWPECDGQDFRDVWHSFPLAEHQIPQPANEGYGRQDPEWRRSGLMDDLPVSMCY